MPNPTSGRAGKLRPRRIPPPLTSGNESYDAEPIFSDFQGDLALVLWKTAQSIELWAGLKPSARQDTFAAEAFGSRLRHLQAAKVDADLIEPLVVAADVLRESAGELAVSRAASKVAEWARARGATGTALAFMQAAALAAPTEVRLSLEVGRLARTAGDLPRAESWFRNALTVSRRTEAWEDFGLAYLAVASIYVARGNLPMARKAGIRALRSGRRHGVREVQARAHHDLMQIALLAGKEKDSIRHGRSAVELYGSAHPRLPALANDVAYHWMQKGYFAAALDVFLALRNSLEKPWEILFLLANTARAAAGAGNLPVFEQAWQDALVLLEDSRTREWASAAMIDLARGAITAGDLDRAEWAMGAAAKLAEELSQNQVQFEAEALRQEIASEKKAPQRTPQGRQVRVPAEVRGLSEELTLMLQPAG